MKSILFTRQKLEELRNQHDHARAMGMKQFEFHGNPLLTDYAKYLIEYLEMQFELHPPTHNGKPN